MKIIVSAGDANGIGIEVFLKAAEIYYRSSESNIEFTICGNQKTIAEYIDFLPDKFRTFAVKNDKITIAGHQLKIKECGEYSQVLFGETSAASGKLSGKAIEISINEVLNGHYDALLTLPISKEALNLGGYAYAGHTEFLAEKCNTSTPLMILCTDSLNVALVTVHQPLKDVPQSITPELLQNRFQRFYSSLKYDYGIEKPRIAVLSLNPHTGENGKIGSEENQIIIPAMQKSELKEYLYGPFPADGFFAHGDYKEYSGVLAMYHDQGLIPLKLIAKGGGVNFTAGLPIIRTSPDHGTAFNLAGKGVADAESTYQAILLAEKIWNTRNK